MLHYISSHKQYIYIHVQVADELIDAVKKGLGSRLACSLPLPDYSAGEVEELFRKACDCAISISWHA